MVVYMDLVVILNFSVNFLLLLGTNRLAGYPPAYRRTALSAALGGVYGGVCLISEFAFLGNTLWRTVCLLLMGGIAFGFQKSALRRCALFFLLSMALGGVALGMGQRNFFALILAAGGVAALCFYGFRGKLGHQYVNVELCHGKQSVKLTALRDTGNTLRDPVTGQGVLVVGPEIATALTGLTIEQLKNPASAIGTIPGLRLVPYRAVGVQGGLLLALKLENTKIGTWQGSRLVAFAPESFGEYEGLIGGIV